MSNSLEVLRILRGEISEIEGLGYLVKLCESDRM